MKVLNGTEITQTKMTKQFRKYVKSTFRGEQIKHLEVNSFDTLTLVTKSYKETFNVISYHKTDNRELSADYLICEVQDNINIKVRKW